MSIGECDSCDGKRYQIKCDNKTYSINSNICGVYGGYGNSCTDDGGTYFRECICPLNYEWSATALKCVCSSAFKYTCTGTGYAGGDGESCDGKYKACICAEGYSWDAATGKCLLSCANECSLTTCPSPFTCRYEECSKRYCKTGCEAGYDWDASTQTCNSQCSASYKYDESNCPSSSKHHCSEPCGDKYTDCKSLPSEVRGLPKTFKTGDITWVSDSVASCPNQELNISEDASPVRLQFGNIYYAECLTGDSACEKLSDFVNDRKSSLFGKTVSYNVTQDMNCGNIIMTRENKVNASGATFLINGNGHTLNFTRTAEASFSDTRTASSNPAHIVLDNIRIIQKTNSFFTNNNQYSCNWYGNDPNVFDTGVTLKSNVYVEAERTNTRLGTLIQKSATVKSSVFAFEVGANATLNILPYGTYTNGAKISVNNNSVVNFKNFQCQYCNLQTYYGGALIEVHGSNSIINMCAASESAALQFSFIKNCYPITVNANRDIRINYSNSSASCPNSVTVKIDSSVCSKMNF